jgi:hypothetical protein
MIKMTPLDSALYERIKRHVWAMYKKPSAYRSGMLVKLYKEAGGRYAGEGQKKLKRWFDEKWTNQRGEVGYKYKSDVYRPTVRVSKETPVTFNELSHKEIANAREEKLKTGRVKRFHD